MAHTYTRVNWAASGAKMSAANLNIMDVGINDGFTDLADHIASSSEHTGLAKSALGSYVGDGVAQTRSLGLNPYLLVLYGLEDARYWFATAGAPNTLNLVTLAADSISLATGGLVLAGSGVTAAGNAFGKHYVWVAWGV